MRKCALFRPPCPTDVFFPLPFLCTARSPHTHTQRLIPPTRARAHAQFTHSACTSDPAPRHHHHRHPHARHTCMHMCITCTHSTVWRSAVLRPAAYDCTGTARHVQRSCVCPIGACTCVYARSSCGCAAAAAAGCGAEFMGAAASLGGGGGVGVATRETGFCARWARCGRMQGAGHWERRQQRQASGHVGSAGKASGRKP